MSEPSSDPMRRALRALTHGVYVLSTHHKGVDDFLIVSLAMQTSVEPPRVAFAVSVNARILSALRQSGKGVLGVLPKGAVAAVRRYGAPGGVRHAPVDAARSAHHITMPPEASFWLELSVHNEVAAGDHALFVADVTAAKVADSMLAYHAVADGAMADGAVTDGAVTDDAVAHGTLTDGAVATFVSWTLADSGFPYGG